ncbi:DUF5069 domain-containing protein [Cerasicoccus fimbriatus]|uniref:DUF5069 domain-containing protein n=1 Tax=Cerasicoccus fimbriatus TaxID=3014554 RepID=UPI0022B5598C|nr:DUF5069 domain-containing protein [Cerasicoccus sp. TK19100]
MKLPAPRDEQYGCIWLPRLREKARLFLAEELPAEYLRAFCLPPAVDGLFLTHFNTSKEAFLTACTLPEDAFEAWFLTLQDNSPEHIAAWNESVVNFGRPGYPMAERFPWAKENFYPNLAHLDLQTVFEALEYDEGIRTE